MEQREAMDLYGFFCDRALREKKTWAAVVQRKFLFLLQIAETLMCNRYWIKL